MAPLAASTEIRAVGFADRAAAADVGRCVGIMLVAAGTVYCEWFFIVKGG
nr:hypothetical protein [Candidatus Microthrix sp.]